jgi:hypothetical protein
MRVQIAVLLGIALVGTRAPADTYRVRNTNDLGPGSLRWAIDQASKHAGRDKVVFAARLAGRTIRPQTPLPDIEDARTIIDGDIDGDGAPDIALNGRDLSTGSGLTVSHTSYCRISGLAIINFPYTGIDLYQGDYSTIRSCHVGVNLAGTKWVPNGLSSISLGTSSHNTIGGSSPADRNVIGGGAGSGSFGVVVDNASMDNTITGNYLGITRDGMTAFGGGYGGIHVGESADGTISGNVFGGFDRCVDLANAHDTLVAGNYFGLAADGDSLLPINIGVMVKLASTGNTIGGTTAAARNVFAGDADSGVRFIDDGTENNRVQGNYFGLNAAGTQQRRIRECVAIIGGCGWPGRQTIGGGTPRAGNYFTPKSSDATYGVMLSLAGGGTIIQHNRFGVMPDGTNATVMHAGIEIHAVNATILDNTLARADDAIVGSEAGANARIFRNTFRACGEGIYLKNGARCVLGNLGNANPNDDGGNLFRPSNAWHIRNFTANRITAEGNRFGTTSRAAIDAKIWDRRDDDSLGRVDFNPLAGGVIPTGEALPLRITGAGALATRAGGAEIAFSLSAPAGVTVTVLNIAGRPVATVLRDSATDSGLQRVVWSGQISSGAGAPNGTYLVRIVARDDEGRQAQSLCSLWLAR